MQQSHIRAECAGIQAAELSSAARVDIGQKWLSAYVISSTREKCRQVAELLTRAAAVRDQLSLTVAAQAGQSADDHEMGDYTRRLNADETPVQPE